MTLDCPKCGLPLAASRSAHENQAYCEICRAERQVHVFPAFFQAPRDPQRGERLLVDTEASCFYHPKKKAHTTCETCGRFICQLCHTDVANQSICLNCLTSPSHNHDQQKMDNTSILHDNIAIHLALIPLLIWPITFVTAPMTLFLVLKHWRQGPTSVIPRTRIRYVMAFILALIQIGGWGLLIYEWLQ